MSARPMPVLPAVASTIVPPGVRRPSFSAARMIPLAARSFTLPPGLRYSNLAYTAAAPAEASFFNCRIGVSPTSWEISSVTRKRELSMVFVLTLQGTEEAAERQLYIQLSAISSRRQPSANNAMGCAPEQATEKMCLGLKQRTAAAEAAPVSGRLPFPTSLRRLPKILSD